MSTKKKRKEVDQWIKRVINIQTQEKAIANLEPIEETNKQEEIKEIELVFINKDNESAIVELTQLDKEDITTQIKECKYKIERLTQEHKTK